MFFIKNKTIKDIEARARSKERQKLETHYNRELEKQRERFSVALTEQERNINIKHDLEMKNLKQKYSKELIKWREKLNNNNAKIRNYQRAYLIIKEFVPQGLNLANMLRSEAFTDQQKATAKLGRRHGIEDGFEKLQRDLLEIAPQMEKLINNK